MQDSDSEPEEQAHFQGLLNLMMQAMASAQNQQGNGHQAEDVPPPQPSLSFSEELTKMYEDSEIIYNPDFESKLIKAQKDISELTMVQAEYQQDPNLTSLENSLPRLHLSRCVLHWAQSLKPSNLQEMYSIFYQFIKDIKTGDRDLTSFIDKVIDADKVDFPDTYNDFENNCGKYKMIREYTKNTFFHKLVALATRKANLRAECTSTIAFAIYQLNRELSELSNQQLRKHMQSNESYHQTVYRGMKKIDAKQIKTFKAIKAGECQIFQFEGCISTSKQIDTACKFAGDKYLVEIEIDLKLSLKSLDKHRQLIKGCFADVSQSSEYAHEKEVLFSCFNYFEFIEYEAGSPSTIRLKYIDVESALNKPRQERSPAEVKVLESYNKTERIIRSQVVNQGGLFFINFDFNNFYQYHLNIAKKMVEKAPAIQQSDQFINRHRSTLEKLAWQVGDKPPTMDYLRKLVGYCVQQLSCNNTYTSSFVFAYIMKQENFEMMWMKFDLLTRFTKNNHRWILITIMWGLYSNNYFVKSDFEDEVNQYLSSANRMSGQMALFSHSIAEIIKSFKREERGIVCSSYRSITLQHLIFLGWFDAYEYTMNLWTKNTFEHMGIVMNLYFIFLKLLIERCFFDKAQNVLKEIRNIIQFNWDKQSLNFDCLQKLRKQANSLQAYFYLKQFLCSQQKKPALAEKARNLYEQLVKEEQVKCRLHALFYNLACICLHVGPLEKAQEYIGRIVSSEPAQEMQLQALMLSSRLQRRKQESFDTKGLNSAIELLRVMLNNKTQLSGDCIMNMCDYLDELQNGGAGDQQVIQFSQLAYRMVRWSPPSQSPSSINGKLLLFEHFKTICQTAFQKVKTELQSTGSLHPLLAMADVDKIDLLIPNCIQQLKAFCQDLKTVFSLNELEDRFKEFFKDSPQILSVMKSLNFI